MEEWQVCFEVKGLVAPEKPLKFDNIAFKKASTSKDDIPLESDDRSIVFLKASSDKTSEFMAMRKNLQAFLSLYGLVTGKYVECPKNYICYQISESYPFGEIEHLSKFYGAIKLSDKQKEKHARLLSYSVQMFNEFSSVFTEHQKRHLKNAITYHYRALKDMSYLSTEEALIDEMISLESLLESNSQMLSLRASILLSLEGKKDAYDIKQKFDNLREKRHKIVHGSESVSVTLEEMFELIEYVRKIIWIFLKLEKSKKDLIDLLDKSILEWDFRKKLEQLYQRHFKQINNQNKKA
jgi:hypothetical protein